MEPTWVSDCGTVKLWCADCLDVLPTLPKVDAVVTDPPYGVGFEYESHDDTQVGYVDWCRAWHSACEAISSRLAVSCGMSNITSWPKPKWVFCWHKPAAMGRCPIGFNNWEPVLFYGKPVRQTCDVFQAVIVPDKSIDGHPCPKPLGWGLQVVGLLSSDSETILDPFMGSGTTGVAAVRLGRKFLGIEKEPKYFEIAKKRIKEELERFKMFEPQEAKPVAKNLPGFE